MKIALITIWHEKNFGAEMQCYATVKALESLGHKVEVIDFRLADSENISLRRWLINTLVKFSPEVKSFNRFWKKYIPSGRHYISHDELCIDPPNADMFLVGSDQVWNPDITKEKWSAYFLDFVRDSTPRYAYASSIGEDDWQWSDIQEMAYGLLGKFSKIATRETSGQALLASKFGIKADVVIDPTLLHTNYDEIIKPDETKKTLVYYPLTENLDLEKCAKELSAEIGLEFIDTNKKSRLFGRTVWNRTSIEDWIKNIAEASLVITPSFHGLAFSLIYKRQFIIVQNAKGKNRSSRIIGLLKKLGLEDRYFTSIDSMQESEVWKRPIDYDRVTPLLDSLRFDSWSYLKNITEG